MTKISDAVDKDIVAMINKMVKDINAIIKSVEIKENEMLERLKKMEAMRCNELV